MTGITLTWLRETMIAEARALLSYGRTQVKCGPAGVCRITPQPLRNAARAGDTVCHPGRGAGGGPLAILWRAVCAKCVCVLVTIGGDPTKKALAKRKTRAQFYIAAKAQTRRPALQKA